MTSSFDRRPADLTVAPVGGLAVLTIDLAGWQSQQVIRIAPVAALELAERLIAAATQLLQEESVDN